MVLLYSDEASFYRQPTQASLYAPRGREQPAIHWAPRGNTVMRVGGFLNAVTGEVHHWETKSVTAEQLRRWWLELARVYRHARKVYLVMDNLPTHLHPRAVSAFEADERLSPLYLPTYSPWLNPIEKLWRLAKQTVAHAHHYCDNFDTFRSTVNGFLERPAQCGTDVLRYVGLSYQ